VVVGSLLGDAVADVVCLNITERPLMIGALERPDASVIISNGIQVTGLRGKAQADYRRTVRFVFQRYNLLPALTGLDNVIAPVLPYRTTWDEQEKARQLLEALGLGGRERSLPARMSGGEQLRIAIARALINTPALVLADEPTGNLDSATATGILDLLTDLRATHDMTILLASHDPQVAARAERLIRLRDGQIIDDIARTTDRPAHETHPQRQPTRLIRRALLTRHPGRLR
jgi:putative ABC transport system ATP-binding protein